MHFQLGGRLDLHWLRDQIAALPRTNRWQAMARAALRDDLFAAESTGLKPRDFDPLLSPYLEAAGEAAAWGYAAAFIGVTIIGVAGLILALRAPRTAVTEPVDQRTA